MKYFYVVYQLNTNKLWMIKCEEFDSISLQEFTEEIRNKGYVIGEKGVEGKKIIEWNYDSPRLVMVPWHRIVEIRTKV